MKQASLTALMLIAAMNASAQTPLRAPGGRPCAAGIPLPSMARATSFESADDCANPPQVELPELAAEATGPSEPAAGVSEQAACGACPRRQVGRAFLQVAVINGLYGLANLARGQATAKVTPRTWWSNISHGWVWDLDGFLVNQIGHPYQGSNYFAAGRSKGLGFYEAAGMTAFGSGTWEFFGETNHPSLNDFINTTLGGVALGEVLHRTAGWFRGHRGTESGKRWNELAAGAIDPVGGWNRFFSKDDSAAVDPPELPSPSFDSTMSAGLLWRTSSADGHDWQSHPFVHVDLFYGDMEAGYSRTPYEAFNVRLTAGGGGGVSEARVRGRLLGEPLSNNRLYLTVVQNYSFLGNEAYNVGGQSFEASLGGARALTSQLSLALMGWGGLTVLGAVDSRPVADTVPGQSREPTTSRGHRRYDYGPGSTFGASAALKRNGRVLATFLYEGRTIYSLDGIRANHLLQRARLDLRTPLRGRMGLGVTGEFLSRRSYFQDSAATQRRYRYPEFRAHLSWALS